MKNMCKKGLLRSFGAGHQNYDTSVGAIGFSVSLQNLICTNVSAQRETTAHKLIRERDPAISQIENKL